MNTNRLLVVAFFTALGLSNTHAQDKIFRCGNEYTNNAADAAARGCKALEGGNITIIQAPPAPPATRKKASSAATPSSAVAAIPKVDNADQRARDADAHTILEGELRKAEQKRGELAKDYNNGEPERQGAEARNYQKYLDRVAEMKASLARADADIAGIKREIARLPAR